MCGFWSIEPVTGLSVLTAAMRMFCRLELKVSNLQLACPAPGSRSEFYEARPTDIMTRSDEVL